MEKQFDSLAKSKKIAAKTIFEAFKILKEEKGPLPGKEVRNRIRDTIEFDEWENSRFEKSGQTRWEKIFLFYSINCIKAGYLIKNKGIWYLTPEGEKAVNLGPVKLLEDIIKKYHDWAVENKKPTITEGEDELPGNDSIPINLSQLEEQAIEGLKEYLVKKGPYEFQDMVAALLRAMGYYTPFIAPKGPDGGIDIIAYQDPLGTKAPRIKVQVKHQPDTSIAVDKIKSLIGSLNKDNDVGLFVTSGKFTSDSRKAAFNSHTHVKLIDFAEFISLWQQFYNKLTDEEKNMLPLQPIYFLGVNE